MREVVKCAVVKVPGRDDALVTTLRKHSGVSVAAADRAARQQALVEGTAGGQQLS
jgi:hypothetical protein